jgi:hypothetical protein
MTPSDIGKLLLAIGIGISLLGLALMLAGRLNLPWLGHLPGDLSFKGRNFSFYFPITTCLLVSVVLSVLLWLISRR